MSGLLDEVLTAHGGLERWRAVTALMRRHDYVAQPIGRWARAVHYCNDHREFAGLVFPTRRRVHPRGPGGRPLPYPILVALDIDEIEIET
jgi:hypothetical protein